MCQLCSMAKLTTAVKSSKSISLCIMLSDKDHQRHKKDCTVLCVLFNFVQPNKSENNIFFIAATISQAASGLRGWSF